VSVRKPGEPYGTRREIKNLNSFRNLLQAVDFEVNWQIDEIEDGRKIQQATVLFNPDTGETRAMRSKEDSADYRYFPDPDLPPLVIANDWIERVRGEMPELPSVMAARFESEYRLPSYDAAMMTQTRSTARYFEDVVEQIMMANADPAGAVIDRSAKLAANWIMGEVSRRLNAEERSIAACPIHHGILGKLITRIQDGTISNNAAKQVFEALWSGEGSDVDAVIEAKGLKQVSDTGAIEAILDEILAANQKSVEEFRSGKEKAFNALVGQAMKATKGKANPSLVNELLKKKLGA